MAESKFADGPFKLIETPVHANEIAVSDNCNCNSNSSSSSNSNMPLSLGR